MKIPVQVIYDTDNNTWNVMTMNGWCLKYGTAEDIDEWLFMNSQTHEEIE